ncbi:MAG: hypothetical protein WKG07_48050 [Hymenobacter sp.]
MLSPANGFYQTPGLGRQQVRLAYVLNLHRPGRRPHLPGAGAAGLPRPHAAGSSGA